MPVDAQRPRHQRVPRAWPPTLSGPVLVKRNVPGGCTFRLCCRSIVLPGDLGNDARIHRCAARREPRPWVAPIKVGHDTPSRRDVSFGHDSLYTSPPLRAALPACGRARRECGPVARLARNLAIAFACSLRSKQSPSTFRGVGWLGKIGASARAAKCSVDHVQEK